MGIVNRRNAAVGWAALKIGKRVAKQKAKSVVPGAGGEGAGSALPKIAVPLAGLGAALLFWRRRHDDGIDDAAE